MRNSLHIDSGKGVTHAGKITIVSENEGCWACYTDKEGKDPSVWAKDYGWTEDFPKWRLINNSLSQFLVTFCLINAFASSKYHRVIKDLSSYKNPEQTLAAIGEDYDAYLLWQGHCAENVIYEGEICYPDRFYSIEDAILIWENCATNHKNADRFLTSI